MTKPKTAAEPDPFSPKAVAPPIPQRRRRSSDKTANEPAPARTKKSAKATHGTAAKPALPVVAKKATKRDQLAALLLRHQGATLDQMIALTGWLPHTVRAAMSGLRKAGYAIDSDKVDDLRTYRAVAPK